MPATPLPGWWVIEAFNPDGSASFSVTQFTQAPQPPDNQAIYGTWPTKAAAEQAVSDGSFRHAAHVYRGGNISKGPGTLLIPGIQAPGNPVPKVTSPLAAIGQFFTSLTQANTWIRVAEVLAGIVLLAIGVARITDAVPVATKIAGIAAKGAVLA